MAVRSCAEDIRPPCHIFLQAVHIFCPQTSHYSAGLMSLWGREQLPFKWKTEQDWAVWCPITINTRDVTNNSSGSSTWRKEEDMVVLINGVSANRWVFFFMLHTWNSYTPQRELQSTVRAWAVFWCHIYPIGITYHLNMIYFHPLNTTDSVFKNDFPFNEGIRHNMFAHWTDYS